MFKILSHGVKIRAQTSRSLHVSLWEDFLVVCPHLSATNLCRQQSDDFWPDLLLKYLQSVNYRVMQNRKISNLLIELSVWHQSIHKMVAEWVCFCWDYHVDTWLKNCVVHCDLCVITNWACNVQPIHTHTQHTHKTAATGKGLAPFTGWPNQ